MNQPLIIAQSFLAGSFLFSLFQTNDTTISKTCLANDGSWLFLAASILVAQAWVFLNAPHDSIKMVLVSLALVGLITIRKTKFLISLHSVTVIAGIMLVAYKLFEERLPYFAWATISAASAMILFSYAKPPVWPALTAEYVTFSMAIFTLFLT